jgi:SGNH hydrolase-like domain, acetyltransferase AlgX
MAQLSQPLPSAGPSRGEIAKIEVGHTTITPATARFLLAFFLTVIAGVPIAEWAGARTLTAQDAATPWSRLFSLPKELQGPLADTTPSALDSGVWRRTVALNRIVLAALREFERALDAESLIGWSLRPTAQAVMTGWLGVGNERVYRGRDGWLFYRPDVEYITAQEFLDPASRNRRIAAAAEWNAPPEPDPRGAIVQFKRDLEARGIALVVMPTPIKPTIHPEMLALRYGGTDGALQNPSYRALIEDLTREGVLVFDPSESLMASRRTGPQYLATDTHWRPESMEAVAELLARFITTAVRLPSAANPGYRIEGSEVRNAGDTAQMLDLADDDVLYPPEVVWLRRVLHEDGSPWHSSRDADVLVLGDSFSNIYALESMRWGTSAGFVEQLSYALRRPVDRIVQNDQGAFATRAALARDPDRLVGKRLILYQFAARELAFGNWKVIPLPVQNHGP